MPFFDRKKLVSRDLLSSQLCKLLNVQKKWVGIVMIFYIDQPSLVRQPHNNLAYYHNIVSMLNKYFIFFETVILRPASASLYMKGRCQLVWLDPCSESQLTAFRKKGDIMNIQKKDFLIVQIKTAVYLTRHFENEVKIILSS